MLMQPKGWNDFQHYKDRNPPWIKLHKSLLDNFEFQSLPVASKALAPMLWLIASCEVNGVFDAADRKLSFRLRMTERELKEALKPLISNGFFILYQDDGMVLADSKQPAIPETETETDKSKRQRTEIEAPDGVSSEVWESFVAQRKASRSAITQGVINSIGKEALKAGWTLENALAECAARGWRGFKASWVADKPAVNAGGRNREVMSGLTRGLVGGTNNVKLLG